MFIVFLFRVKCISTIFFHSIFTSDFDRNRRTLRADGHCERTDATNGRTLRTDGHCEWTERENRRTVRTDGQCERTDTAR